MTSRRTLKPFVWSIPFAEEQLKATAEGMMSYNKWIVRVTITYPDDHPSPTSVETDTCTEENNPNKVTGDINVP